MLPEDRYVDRDLSWLTFNERVLMEAADPSLPIYERVKFLAIYSSNLNEFFKVRVASVRSLMGLKKKKQKKLGLAPGQLLKQITATVKAHQERFGDIWRNQILPALEAEGIILLQGPATDEKHIEFLSGFFESEIQPFLHPELLMKNRVNHFLRDSAVYLAVSMLLRLNPEDHLFLTPEERQRFSLIQIPTQYLPRFVELPMLDGKHYYMFLDDVIRMHLPDIFPGFDVQGAYLIKLTRNADLQIVDEFKGNLVEKIRKSLKKRQIGVPSRFLYDQEMPPNMLSYLQATFELSDQDLITGGRYHNFFDLFGLPNPLGQKLEYDPAPPLPKPELESANSMLEVVGKQNWVLHFPYQTYDYVIWLLNEAAVDPEVTQIMATQYRVASNSAIVDALVRAAQNGKKVTVFVEIKARFDEAANLLSAQKMEEAGVRIIYSVPGLKVHAKVALILKGETQMGYAYLSTGNFNEKTARVYADHGYFTSEPEVIAELQEVFKYLCDMSYEPPPFKHLLVAPFNLRQTFMDLIDREIEHAHAGEEARILIKINNLEDPGMIDKLYEASQAGVHIRMIVRGICCLKPGVPRLSENIVVTRLVDRYLEHARVFVFYNRGEENMYLSSSDWMVRNLYHRVEIGFPIHDATIKAEIMAILNLQLADRVKAVRLDQDSKNAPLEIDPNEPSVRAQTKTYELIRDQKLVSAPVSTASE